LVDIAIENNFHFIDCQVPTPHLKKLGATQIPRPDFLAKLNDSITDETKNLNWNMV
jgi:leucyl/phenylalanyl-tRNA--protein transferase